MNIRATPSRKTVLEAAGLLLVVLGFVRLIQVFNSIGYLPAPFVFDVYDTFMDWFNTAYWAHNPGAYSVWRTIYLPLSFVVTGLLGDPRCYGGGVHPYDSRACDEFGIVVILAIFAACLVVSAIAFYRNDKSTWIYRSLAVAISGPMLFALERGNLILVAYIPFVLIFGQLLRSKFAEAVAAAVVVNMKVYLLFPIFAFAIKREWRRLELIGIASLGVYLLSMVYVGAGTPLELADNLRNWFHVRETAGIWDEVLYSTTYKPYLLLDVRQYPVRDYIPQQWVDAAKIFISVEVVLSRGLALFCLLCAWFYPRAVSLHRLVFFILMQSFIGQNPGGYSMILIVFLVFLEKNRGLASSIAVFCAYLICISTDINIASIAEVARDSWLGQRWVISVYALPLGALIRPGILLIMLWTLSIDTLLRIHREVKSKPATVGLMPRQQRALTSSAAIG